MIEVGEALRRVLGAAPLLSVERLQLSESLGRVLAQPITASVSVPPWDNSAMDGYAVRAEDVIDGGKLQVVGECLAGQPHLQPLELGQAVVITTGAMVPPGATAVVMVEKTSRTDDVVSIEGAVRVGQNIRRAGQDLVEGEVALTKGTLLNAPKLGLLASLGVCEVQVFRRPKVVVLATGDELQPGGAPLAPGKIYSSNSTMIAAFVREAGGEVIDGGIVGDTLDQTVTALRSALSADVVISTGGVSVGQHDFVKDAMEIVGLKMDFWKVSMKPGKPLAFGVSSDGQTVVFGLPGNPTSAGVTFLQFVRPVLMAMMGSVRRFLPTVSAKVDFESDEKPGRTKFIRVSLSRDAHEVSVNQVGITSSGALKSLALADGLLIAPANSATPKRGGQAVVQLLPGLLAEDAGFAEGEGAEEPSDTPCVDCC